MDYIPIEYPSLNLIAGSCGSGKTYLLKSLIYSNAIKKNIGYITVLTNSPDDYNFIPENFVIVPQNQDHADLVIQKLMRAQEIYKSRGNIKKCLIIIDDCLGTINFNSKIFLQLNTRFRKYNFGIFYTTQHINKLPPVIRECCFNSFIFQQNTLASIESCYENFGLNFKKLIDFREYMQKTVPKYHFIHFNRRQPTDIKVKHAQDYVPNFKLKF